MRARAASASKPISEVQPSSPICWMMSISDVSTLPETRISLIAKPLRAVKACTTVEVWPPTIMP